MNATLMIGTRVVVFALIAYSVGIITEQRKRQISAMVLVFLTSGIILDITATLFMIIGSPNSPFTLHGFLGYSALCAMLVETFLAWRFRILNGTAIVPRRLHLYSRYAYLWWVVAFITGSLLVIFK